MSNKEYRPTLAQLRTFVTIAENRHFGTAATKLNISQPSLSQALVSLENGLGVQLIERSTRRVIVTPIGESLLPFAKATLDAAEAFIAHAQGNSGVLSGNLAVGIIPTIAPYILPELYKELAASYPDLELQIVEDQTQHLLSQLKDGHIDCALLALPVENTGIVEIPLYAEHFKIVVSESNVLAGREDVKLSSLADLNLLLLDDGHCLRDQVVDLCRKADVNPLAQRNAETKAASLTTVMQLVSAGIGSTLIPESAVSIETNREGVATASFAQDVTASRQVGLVYRASSTREDTYLKLGSVISEAFYRTIGVEGTDGTDGTEK